MTTWAEVIALVNEQAEDDGLWFMAETASEAYLQEGLRALHAAVEGLTEERRHQIEFDEAGWVIAHPLVERLTGSLFDCQMIWDQDDPGTYGRYWLHADGTLGEEIET